MNNNFNIDIENNQRIFEETQDTIASNSKAFEKILNEQKQKDNDKRSVYRSICNNYPIINMNKMVENIVNSNLSVYCKNVLIGSLQSFVNCIDINKNGVYRLCLSVGQQYGQTGSYVTISVSDMIDVQTAIDIVKYEVKLNTNDINGIVPVHPHSYQFFIIN